MDENKQNGSRVWLWVFVSLLVLIVAGFLIWFFVVKDRSGNEKNSTSTAASATASSGAPVSISQKILTNKFGWLGGGAEDDGSTIIDRGGAWVRPHPGSFVWDAMQKSASSEIDFTLADQEIQNYSKNNVAIMVTIWPFADWDQQKLTNPVACKVGDNDEFLSKNDKKGRGAYIPQYRCNPSDWVAYQTFVQKIVERYDGDGVNDMPGLVMPVKYWEVMNEPDLQYQNNLPQAGESSLNFYKQGPDEYAQLLVKTYQAVKKSDTNANVLIAGAAGADSRMLNFYRQVFTNAEALTSFDIGNVHCISNDRMTHDFNVAAYKKMLSDAGVTAKPIWVTEAEAFYGTTGEENYQSTKTSVSGAIAAGAERIFFTRYTFDDFRTDMSKTNSGGTFPSAEKYLEIIQANN
ncbi:MAG: glycosyl hydrolase [Patescibacteria group bacterium]|jgi:hypothetical protein